MQQIQAELVFRVRLMQSRHKINRTTTCSGGLQLARATSLYPVFYLFGSHTVGELSSELYCQNKRQFVPSEDYIMHTYLLLDSSQRLEVQLVFSCQKFTRSVNLRSCCARLWRRVGSLANLCQSSRFEPYMCHRKILLRRLLGSGESTVLDSRLGGS